MNKRKVGFSIGRREIVAMIVGSLLYGGISWFTNFMRLADALGVDVRPAIVVPIVFGFVYGPVVGFVVGLAGNSLGDWWSWQAFYWNWELGNGLMGLIPGLYATFGRRYRTFGDQVLALLVACFGIVGGMALAAYLDVWVCREGAAAATCAVTPVTVGYALDQEFLPVVKVNLVNAVILVPLLLFNVERLDLSSADWLRSGLLRRLVGVIVISAGLPIALLGFFLFQQFSGQSADVSGLTLKMSLTVVVTLLFTVANAALLAQSISRPLLRLTRASEAMGAGKLTAEQAAELKSAEGSDEISNLGRRFGEMAEEVIRREERLRRQVEELKIVIDEAKKEREVAEITESEYFQELKRKAEAIRQRGAARSEVTPVSST